MKKLHNISHYCAVSDIKPEIANVLIKNDPKKRTLEVVATDSYRLAYFKYDLDEFYLLERIETGLYEPRAFKEMCAVLNKKKATIENKMDAVDHFRKFKRNLSPDSYPDYKQLFNKNDNASSVMFLSNKYMGSYLTDHVKLVSELSDRGEFNASEHKEFPHTCLEFKTDEARILLMGLCR